jgi:protein-L-isoaspartate(D-aspartate) O-methyltransferase
MSNFEKLRAQMVERQIAGRGIRSERVLEALRAVPREAFVPAGLADLAYADTSLPIEEEQAISQPFVVAMLAETLDLSPHDRVLEVGLGSGYAAAVLSRIGREVYTVESHEALADLTRRCCGDLGYTNVSVLHADGSLGWTEHAPYDAIIFALGGSEPLEPLLSQLSIDGRLLMPLGLEPRAQVLLRITRRSYDRYERESLGPIRFVPGFEPEEDREKPKPASSARSRGSGIPRLVREVAHPLSNLEDADLGPLMERIGDSRVVLLGAATDGTSEFHRLRARITRELIARRGFTTVAVEADWPDAARVDHYVRRTGAPAAPGAGFSHFPTWMWRNREVRDFVHWLYSHNAGVADPSERTGFHGLDLYGLYASRHAVLEHLEDVDPEAAQVARLRYGCLTPWERDPAVYRRIVQSPRYASHESDVASALHALLQQRLATSSKLGERVFDGERRDRLLSSADDYYRSLYYGSRSSWNLRDQHMFKTLEGLLEVRGNAAKAVVWVHNAHAGDAAHTEMGTLGERSLGQLAREHYGKGAFLVGFGTHSGTVASASAWGAKLELAAIRPAHPESYGRLFHQAEIPAFLLQLRDPDRTEVSDELAEPRLERAIGAVYRPDSELRSHFFQASLSRQFDAYIWLDETSAVTPFSTREVCGMPDAYPFRP